MNTIELPRPHGFLIWKGTQTAIADAATLPVGEKLLIVSDGEAFGHATLGEPAQIKAKATAFHSDDWQEQHCIRENERRLYWPDAEILYVHQIANWEGFEKSKSFENGKAIDRQLTDSDRKLIDQAKQLPKMITLDSEAVVFCGGKFITSKIAYTDELKAILKATYDKEPEFTDKINADELPIYQLALVRNPNMTVKKKDTEKQEDVIMPWEKIQNHPGCSESESWAVVKVDGGELEGCHGSEEAANAQLAALNIAEQERALHTDDEDEEDEDKDLHGIEPLEQRLARIQEQFFRVDNANVVHTFEDHLIVESGGDLFNVNFSQIGDQLVFDPREKWMQVEVSFTPRLQSDSRSWKDKLKGVAKTIFKGKDEPPEDDTIRIGDTPFGIAVKDVHGEPWHFTWSTNAFEDREGEIFTTKALEDFVLENEQKEDKGKFNLWHIPGTNFAQKQWQGVIGRFLIEAGPYLDNVAGQAAKEFFTEFSSGHPDFAPEGWGSSPEFRFLPEEREKDGVYHWLWITKTSTLPRAAAANTYTKGNQIMALSKDQEALAVATFGKDFVEMLKIDAETKTAELEEAGVAHKENETTEAETQEAETEETTTEEETEQPAQEAISVDIDQLAAAVSSQFVLKLEPIAEAIVKMAEGTKELTERVAQLEKQEAVKAQVETPRFTLQLTRASEAVETVVKDGDDLKEAGPKQKDKGAGDFSRIYFNNK